MPSSNNTVKPKITKAEVIISLKFNVTSGFAYQGKSAYINGNEVLHNKYAKADFSLQMNKI